MLICKRGKTNDLKVIRFTSVCIFCLLIFFSSACSREAPETNDSLLPTQLGEVKNGYVVLWRIVVTLSHEERDGEERMTAGHLFLPLINHPTFPLVEHNTHWEDAKTLCIFIAEYVPIDTLRVKGDGVEIPLSVMKNENTPSAQYLFFKEGVMLRVEFDKKIPDRVEIISMGKI